MKLAIERHGCSVVPCGVEPFSVMQGHLIYWYNVPGGSTKILKERVDVEGRLDRVGIEDRSGYSRKSRF